MAKGFDSGAEYVSLGGIQGRKYAGLVCERPDSAVTFNTGVELLHNNPLRMWAIIQNLDTANVLVCFDSGTGIAPTMLIAPNGSLQIDKMLPWTGPVYLSSATGNVTFMEASVQP